MRKYYVKDCFMNKNYIIKIFERIIEYSLYALIFFIPISTAAIEIFSGVAIFFFLIKKALNPDFGFIRKAPIVYLFLLFFFLSLTFSLFNSGIYFYISLKALFFRWVQVFFIFIIAADAFKTRNHIKKVFIFILLSSILVVVSGLLQKFIGLDFLRGKQMIRVSGDVYGITASFPHYNTLSSYLVLFIPIAIVLNFIEIKRKNYKFGIFLWTLGLILSLLLTFSRAGWLGFLFGIIFLAVLFKEKRGFILFSIFIFFLIIFLVPSLRERMLFTFSSGGDSARFFIWKTGFEMIKENPFLGKGLKTFTEYFQQYALKLNPSYLGPSFNAHNSYIQIWAESGVFALLSFLIFIGIILYKGIKLVKNNQSRIIVLLIMGIICGVFSDLINCFFDSHLLFLQTSAPFWFLLGFLQSVITNSLKQFS